MFPTWEARVKSKGVGDQALDPLVTLHNQRWSQWRDYIEKLEGFEYVRTRLRNLKKDIAKMKKSESDFQIAFVERLKDNSDLVFDKILLRKGEDYILLDASFGSMNTTSDLDVNVVSTTPVAFEVWMDFTRNFVEGSDAASFCEYWDSNFYYEPGVWDGKTVKGLTTLLISKKFAWTTKDTALYELSCVKAYCDAYEGNKSIVIDGRVSSPNPANMTLDHEQQCYRTALFFAEAFRAAYAKGNEDAIRYAYLKYAVTKIEGLVSVPSLAVSRVFGDSGFADFVDKKGSGKYLETYMTGISAYEFLRNLRMHSKNGKYKSKYANRMRYVLSGAGGLCTACSRRFRNPIAKTNSADLRMIERAIVSLLDFMDGESKYENKYGTCPYLSNSKVWLKNLGGKLKILCDRAYDYIEGLIKEDTSEKKRGTKYVVELIKR